MYTTGTKILLVLGENVSSQFVDMRKKLHVNYDAKYKSQISCMLIFFCNIVVWKFRYFFNPTLRIYSSSLESKAVFKLVWTGKSWLLARQFHLSAAVGIRMNYSVLTCVY